MEPFVALMRTYCIDYTNSHDQSLYDEIMEPDYVVHICGFDLAATGLQPRRRELFERSPGPRARRARAASSTATGSACGSASTRRSAPDGAGAWRAGAGSASTTGTASGSPRTSSSRTSWPSSASWRPASPMPSSRPISTRG